MFKLLPAKALTLLIQTQDGYEMRLENNIFFTQILKKGNPQLQKYYKNNKFWND